MGFSQQRAHQRDTGALPAREGGGVGIGELQHLDVLQTLAHFVVAHLLARAWLVWHGKQQVFAHGHVGEQQRFLKQNAHAPCFSGQVVNALMIKLNGAFKTQFGGKRAANGPQQARFARTAGTHDGVNSAGLYR